MRASLLTLSNDTINIYTHLIGFLVLLPVIFAMMQMTVPANWQSTIPLCVGGITATDLPTQSLRQAGLQNFCTPTVDLQPAVQAEMSSLLTDHRRAMLPLLLSAMVCLACSTLYHTFCIRSSEVLNVLVRLDYLGITCLVVGHAITGVYFLFYCTPEVAYNYLPYMVTAFGLTLPVILTRSFASVAYRPVRTLIFGLLGCVAVIPVVHALLRVVDTTDVFAIVSAVGALAIYTCGGVIYAMRFPECCRIGRHDRFLASHQLMHVSVLCGITIQVAATYFIFTSRLQYGCALPS